jgi:hypothetical protein
MFHTLIQKPKGKGLLASILEALPLETEKRRKASISLLFLDPVSYEQSPLHRGMEVATIPLQLFRTTGQQGAVLPVSPVVSPQTTSLHYFLRLRRSIGLPISYEILHPIHSVLETHVLPSVQRQSAAKVERGEVDRLDNCTRP